MAYMVYQRYTTAVKRAYRARSDAAAQAANIAATTLYTVPASGAGMYRVSFYAVITQAATTSSTLPFGQIVYTDNDTSLTNTATFTNTNTANAVGSVAALFTGGGSMPVLNVKPGTIIQYQTTSYASTGATPMQYAVHIKLEYLGN